MDSRLFNQGDSSDVYKYNFSIYFFFFFQAEDGIRDIGVTGVQTCALPISTPLKGLFSVML